MRLHYTGRYVFTSLADLLQNEKLRAALARRRVFTTLGALRKFGATAGKGEGQEDEVTSCRKGKEMSHKSKMPIGKGQAMMVQGRAW